MVEIFQSNEFSFPVEILNSDKTGKDLSGFTVKAAIEFEGKLFATKTCDVESIGLISIPLTPLDTADLGIYNVEIKLEKAGYSESWGTFSYRIVRSIFLIAP